ncbi:MAG: Gfo/Idh/MocA family oxidoreductase [Verrucomicrobia bacterium]|nr:Gfo/Idh/MocA family oxidoreductase [Verrucomicrobiota bacterium]
MNEPAKLNDTQHPMKESSPISRRQFLKGASVAAGTVAAVQFPSVNAQARQPMNAIIIGVGGRGSGAGGNFLEAGKNVGVDAKIVAVADIFPSQARAAGARFNVPDDKCFGGFDAYMRALEVPGVNYAVMATPPGFRPAHFKACIEAGKHVFMEKPVAVDGPGAQIVYAAGELAKKKGLKVAAGTQRRHEANYNETIKRIQDGMIGDIVALRAYWVNGGPIWHRGERGETALEKQVSNWYHYIWLSGDHICEQHVHNIDVCNWIMGGHPVKCWGQGSRQQLGNKSGEIWDNFDVEFEYANGVRMFSYCGQIKRNWASVSEGVHGTNGSANPANTILSRSGKTLFRFREKFVSGYVQEHINLINAILTDTELNEAKNVTDSTLTCIMGREAAYSGSAVEWDAILNSKFAYGPEQVYKDSSKMQWGDFRTLLPPMPSVHDIFKDPPVVPVAAQA